ncbi:MAG: L-rhamnose mutarotase [Phycisphaerae bacterium]|nr:L-rhamnose mutarotase [Phycisphaerae bacterium]
MPRRSALTEEKRLKSFAQALDLANEPGLIEAYKRHHRAVWPEVLAALRAMGIARMKIFLVGSRLFMYFEAPDEFDPSRDFQKYAEDPRCRAWDTWMRTFQRRLAEAEPKDWWTPMEEVFDLERA